jgi:ABC-type polysaccharide/polyol phosphate transport system ATPase subunit
MNNTAIKVSHLTKVYKLYDKPIDRLKESLHPLKKQYHKDFYALNDVSFEIKKGETVGIIGKNGAGKSTLLKIITGVLTPTSGHVHVNGRIASLLELGAGFNPEYTGVENIYLQGTLMGYTKEEMEAKIDNILAFADIGDFVHQSVKMYSSGMFVRLAFAVSIHANPDILIVDEALSVGDMLFQVKCMARMRAMMEAGVTVLFVSHDTHSIKTLCNKAIWIENGAIKESGDAGFVANKYIEMQHLKINETLSNDNNVNLEMFSDESIDHSKTPVIVGTQKREIDTKISQRYGDGRATILDAIILDRNFKQTVEIISKKDYLVQMSIMFDVDLPTFVAGAMIASLDGVQQTGCLNSQDSVVFPAVKKNQIYIVTIQLNIPLRAGTYVLNVACEYPSANNIAHQSLDTVNGFLPLQIVFENDTQTFHSVFYSSGKYAIKEYLQ